MPTRKAVRRKQARQIHERAVVSHAKWNAQIERKQFIVSNGYLSHDLKLNVPRSITLNVILPYLCWQEWVVMRHICHHFRNVCIPLAMLADQRDDYTKVLRRKSRSIKRAKKRQSRVVIEE
jgi:hypothetical protein